jgi:hypothetical protein
MPLNDFETALTERIEFAVFIAYEQWVRATGYDSDNPYDKLARLLPGLPEDLLELAARRGGWGVFDPVTGLPGDELRQLIAELAGAAVAARIAVIDSETPVPGALAQAMAQAVGQAVGGFVGDPESWRLAHGGPGGQPTAIAALAPMAVPEAPLPLDEGPAPRALPPPVVEEDAREQDVAEAELRSDGFSATAERAADPAREADEGGPAQDLVIRAGSSSFQRIGGGDDVFANLLVLNNGTSMLLGDTLLQQIENYAFNLPEVPDLPALQGSGGGTAPTPPVSDPFGDLPPAVVQNIERWIALLNSADFYRVDDDTGQVVKLTADEAREVVDTLIDLLIDRAQLTVAEGPSTTPVPDPAPVIGAPEPLPDEPPPVPVANPGSDVLLVPPMLADAADDDPPMEIVTIPEAGPPVSLADVIEALPPATIVAALPPVDPLLG